jgi:hypothetical protein
MPVTALLSPIYSVEATAGNIVEAGNASGIDILKFARFEGDWVL